MSFRRAANLYEDWQWEEADAARELRSEFAPVYAWVGLATEIIYRSDKHGKRQNWHHPWNEEGAKATEVWKAGGSNDRKIRSSYFTRSLTMLGHCLGYGYIDAAGREHSKTWTIGTAPILAAIGKNRICLVPRSGSVIRVVWTGLRVTSAGLENIRA